MESSPVLFLVALIGPGGAGKSTLAAQLAHSLTPSVNLDADHLKHTIVHPFTYDESPLGRAQWSLLGDHLAYLAKSFHTHGYHVIVNGYLAPPAWIELKAQVVFTNKILLLPD